MEGSSTYVDNTKFAFGLYLVDDLKEDERHFSLTAADIILLNPNTRTCPIFRSKRDMELTKSIYSRVPVLIKEGSSKENPWGIKFFSMFHMANDSHLFRTQEQLELEDWHLEGNIYYKDDAIYLPLYEAKMIWHFNHRFGTYEGATAEELARGKLPELDSQQLNDPDFYPLPNYWVPLPEVKKIYSDKSKWFLCFRSITNASVLRTFIGTIIPQVAAGHSLSFVTASQGNAPKHICFLANLSSFVEDYVMRQNIGGNNLSGTFAKCVAL